MQGFIRVGDKTTGGGEVPDRKRGGGNTGWKLVLKENCEQCMKLLPPMRQGRIMTVPLLYSEILLREPDPWNYPILNTCIQLIARII